MNIIERIENSNKIAILETTDEEKLITDVQSALDLIMTVKYDCNAYRIVINKKAVTDDFFILSSGLAGEILQKYCNYGIKLAIYGDFSKYNSKPLKDFIYESNEGNDFYFVNNEEEAVLKLAMAKS